MTKAWWIGASADPWIRVAKIKLWKSQLLTYHGQKAKTLSWSETSLPRTWKIWIWEKSQIQVGDGSPVPRTLSIIYSGGVIKLSRLSHGPYGFHTHWNFEVNSNRLLLYPAGTSPPCQSYDFLTMEITRFFDQNLGENLTTTFERPGWGHWGWTSGCHERPPPDTTCAASLRPCPFWGPAAGHHPRCGRAPEARKRWWKMSCVFLGKSWKFLG